MATGKVLQFDPSRGYGFVAADDGGEDVFLHASVFDGDSNDLVPGIPLEFQVMAGDRGRKAFAAHVAARVSVPPQPSLVPSQATPSALATSVLPPSLVPSQTLPTTEEEQMCDVLSPNEFASELTEFLLKTIPALTGPQILEIRHGMLEFARNHGWVDA